MQVQLAVFFALGIVLVSGGEPVVECPAPRSPEHGQSFLYREGQVVKYVCEPGYVLRGKETLRCVDGTWEEQPPVCVSMDVAIADDTVSMSAEEEAPLPHAPARPLFNWGSDVQEEESDDRNSTSDDDEVPMGDEARRVRMVFYPRRMARILQVARLNRATELEEEERKRSGGKDKTGGSTTTIHLQAPPSVLYVRRTVGSGKSDSQEKTRTSALHMTVENEDDKEQVQVVSLPRAAQTQSDKGEDALRQYYWMAQQHYYYPRQSSSLVDYTTLGHPYTLSESQMAWINSLHPELRDQYLRDLYVVRSDLDAEGARAQAFLRRYGDAYLYHPYYYRQAMSLMSQDLTSKYDYSCNQAGYNFVTAPKLRNAHIARYDRRQNPNAPNNHYLAAVYRCNPGYIMLDTRFTELFCSRRSWIGTEPVCVLARA